LDVQLNLGVAYAEAGLLEPATEVLERATKTHSRAAITHFNLGTFYARQERYEEAEKSLLSALRIDTGHDAARLALAKVLVRLHRYTDALAAATQYLADRPQPFQEFDARHVEGVALRQLGRLEEAERALTRANELNSSHADVRYNLGFVLMRRGDPERARLHLEKAKELNPDNADIRFQLGNVLRRLQENEAARLEFEEFERRKKDGQQENEAAMLANRGNERLQLGDARGAAQLYEEALGIGGESAETYYNLSIALGQLGEGEQKRIALEKAIALRPGMYQAQNDLGLEYLGAGRLTEARTAFAEALDLNPDFAEAANNLGFLVAQQGQLEEAVELFRKAISLKRDYARAYLNLGLVLADQGKLEDAEGRIREALTLAPEDMQIQTSLGIALARLGRFDEAIETFRATVESNPGSAEAHMNLGIALADQYDLEAALASFVNAVELAPGSPPAHYNKGRALYDLGRHDEARKDLELAGEAPEAMYLLALIEKQRGSLDRSRELLYRVVEADSRNADALYQLGQNHSRSGDAATAAKYWRDAVAVDDNHGQALYNLARVLRATDPEEADGYQRRFRRHQEQRRITDRAETLGNFALASANARDWPQAIEHLREAIEVCGECPTKALLHKNLGLIHARSGDLTRAETALRSASEMLPTDADIQRSLELISSYRRR
jgi:tetratricopeptide (TPR) repeat protein